MDPVEPSEASGLWLDNGQRQQILARLASALSERFRGLNSSVAGHRTRQAVILKVQGGGWPLPVLFFNLAAPLPSHYLTFRSGRA